MTVSLDYLGWTLILGLVQLLGTATVKRQQDGMEWASGNRDSAPPHYVGLSGRMVRALANLYETLPIFIGAVLLAHVSGHDGKLAAWGAAIYFWARVIYVPAYGFGIGRLRSGVWAISLVGIFLVLGSLLQG